MMAAIFSTCGGRLAEKFGIRRIMQLGLVSQMAGFIICLVVPGYMGILTGKLFIGMGMGIVYVTSNTIASMGGDAEYVESAFADVSAGVLSGVTIGAGLGLIILTFADYRIVYLAGALFLSLGPLLSKYLLRTLGAKKSVVPVSLCMAFDMALFVLFPNPVSVFVGMVILAVVISFAYTCQYTYFEGLDECSEAGMGNAMGIYAMFENVGQTLGPVVYGAALTPGNRNGAGCDCSDHGPDNRHICGKPHHCFDKVY